MDEPGSDDEDVPLQAAISARLLTNQESAGRYNEKA